jgi:hypothetical protein
MPCAPRFRGRSHSTQLFVAFDPGLGDTPSIGAELSRGGGCAAKFQRKGYVVFPARFDAQRIERGIGPTFLE